MCDSRKENIRFGDRVTPVTPAGLCLSTMPVNGKYGQYLETSCVFKGIGIVRLQQPVIINYDEWDDYPGLGKLEYINCLIECEDGIGWAGAGALTLAS